MRPLAVIVCVVMTALFACSGKKPAANAKPALGDTVTTATGLRYIVLAEGTGGTPGRGTVVKVHYTGKLTNGKKFDSSLDRGEPLSFPVGVGRVIRAWDEAVLDMKKGEKRILIVPPDLGYGSDGMADIIPPDATLIFEVELVDF